MKKTLFSNRLTFFLCLALISNTLLAMHSSFLDEQEQLELALNISLKEQEAEDLRQLIQSSSSSSQGQNQLQLVIALTLKEKELDELKQMQQHLTKSSDTVDRSHVQTNNILGLSEDEEELARVIQLSIEDQEQQRITNYQNQLLRYHNRQQERYAQEQQRQNSHVPNTSNTTSTSSSSSTSSTNSAQRNNQQQATQPSYQQQLQQRATNLNRLQAPQNNPTNEPVRPRVAKQLLTFVPQPMKNTTGRCWFNAALQCFLRLPYAGCFTNNNLLNTFNTVFGAPHDQHKVDTLFSCVTQEYFGNRGGAQCPSDFVIPFSSIVADSGTFQLPIPTVNQVNTLDSCMRNINKQSLAANDILILDLGRWILTTHRRSSHHGSTVEVKDTTKTPVSFPLELTINNQLYSLSGAILTTTGHAISINKHGNIWYLCDDIIIQQHNNDSIIRKLAQNGTINYMEMLVGTPWVIQNNRLVQYHSNRSYSYVQPGCRDMNNAFVVQTLFYVKK